MFSDGSVVAVGSHDYTTPSSAPDQNITWNNTIGQLPRVIQTGFNGSCPMMVRFRSDGRFEMTRRMLRSGGGSLVFDVDVVEPAGGQPADRSFVAVGSHRGATFGDVNDPNPQTRTIGSTIGVRSSDAFLSCHEPDGNLRWVEVIGGRAADNLVAVLAVPDGEGQNAHTDLIIAGNIGRRDAMAAEFFPDPVRGPKFTLPIQNTEAKFIMRLDFEGNPSMHTPDFEIQWITTFGASGGSTSDFGQVVMDPAGRLYATHAVPTDPETVAGSGIRVPTPYTVWREVGGSLSRADAGTFAVGGRSRQVVMGIDPVSGQIEWDASIDSGNSSTVSRLAPQANGIIQSTVVSNDRNDKSIVGTNVNVALPTGFRFTRTWRIPFDWEGRVLANEIRTDSVQARAIAWSPTVPNPNTTDGRLFATGTSSANATIDENGTPLSLRIPGAPNMEVYIGGFSSDAAAAADPYGGGCGGTDSGPQLGAAQRSLPVLGQNVVLELENALPNSIASLLIGFSRDLFGTLPLPFDLSVIGMNGCMLLCSLDDSAALAVGSGGAAQTAIPVPNDPILVGNSIYTQAAIIDPGANRLGVAVSNGLQLRIGG